MYLTVLLLQGHQLYPIFHLLLWVTRLNLFDSNSDSTSYPAILFYDYIITFSSEVQHFWLAPRNKAAWPSILFFFTRYLTLFGHVLLAIEVFMFPVNDTVSVPPSDHRRPFPSKSRPDLTVAG